ncbi:glycosyltransferase [Janthinobacterium agaricidamnosum]|uniref:Glycosyl transferases group 1 family protein n=1 Tax=Janthinobacterium agaricidamnosum NBRC 102515 = DSM 9628 TaxID=1349767 RepID=W0V701_9BURK|nr:glycosyltransferase [Janthinobacterium agaricidamnosum]CDG84604.1 hypothetical protein GJA_3993 [Janthinobacterium agaricidamnosum NBRC 102515 = DSM 9628]
MSSDKKCLLIVYLPQERLARYPDQMARYEFLKKHFKLGVVISSSNAGLDGGDALHLIGAANPLLFALQAARILARHRKDHDFIFVIGLPAVMAFAFSRPLRPVIAYGPTHYEQHFLGSPGLKGKLVSALKKALFFRGLGRVDSVMAISRQLRELYAGRAKRVVLLPMGVDLSLYSTVVQHRQRLVDGPGDADAGAGLKIVYPGSGGAGRGIELIIACARKMLADGQPDTFHLLGCHDALLEQALREQPALAQVIRVHPMMPYAAVIEQYGRMDAGLSLLQSTIFYAACPPQKIFEYMAAGLPVICNRIATHTDYVGDHALLIDYDADALYQAVLALRRDRGAYQAAALRRAINLRQYAHTTVEAGFVAEIRAQLTQLK